MLLCIQIAQGVDWARVKDIRGFLVLMLSEESRRIGFVPETSEYYKARREDRTYKQLSTQDYISIMCEIAAKHSQISKEEWLEDVKQRDQEIKRIEALKAICCDNI
jgi:hypothetical protein